MFLAATREVTIVEHSLPAPVMRQPAVLPEPVKRVATAIAVGAAVQVGMSVAGRYLARQAARQAAERALAGSGRRGKPKRREDSGGYSSVPDDVVAVNETVIVHRAWLRR